MCVILVILEHLQQFLSFNFWPERIPRKVTKLPPEWAAVTDNHLTDRLNDLDNVSSQFGHNLGVAILFIKPVKYLYILLMKYSTMLVRLSPMYIWVWILTKCGLHPLEVSDVGEGERYICIRGTTPYSKSLLVNGLLIVQTMTLPPHHVTTASLRVSGNWGIGWLGAVFEFVSELVSIGKTVLAFLRLMI